MSKTFVISLGGSLIVPDSIDTIFLNRFFKLIRKQVALGHKFILVCGGGKTARQYIQALNKISTSSSAEQLDWMGISATWVNAKLIQLALADLSYPEIISDPNQKVNFKQKVLVAGGWKPGRSTDDDAVRLAKSYDSSTVINLSNVDYLYNSDPKKNRNAVKIENISWKNYLDMVGKKWDPGANFPFDPVAAQFARKHKKQVIIANGNNLPNLQRILGAKSFLGTIIA